MKEGASLFTFTEINGANLVTATGRLPNKSSAYDVLPVTILKAVAVELAIFLAELFNRSLSAGHLEVFKSAFTSPLMKNLISILPRFVRIRQSRTCLCYRSFSSGSLPGN
jgi:hypothetical protein